MPSDSLTKAILTEVCDSDAQGLAIFADNSISINGVEHVPDETKGYLEFKCSHAFPVVTAFGQALHANVVGRSFKSMKHQILNYEHTMVAYNDQYKADKILGAIVEVEYPNMPHGGFRMTDRENAQGIRAVASFSKLAQGVQRILGRHLGGRKRYSVSMEVQYHFRDSAFAVQLPQGQRPEFKTPDDMVEAGWEVIPWIEAPPDLLSTFSMKKLRVVSDWKKRKVVHLMGGLEGSVHYAGVGVVQFGAEQEAHIMRMAASRTEEEIDKALEPLKKLANFFSKTS